MALVPPHILVPGLLGTLAGGAGITRIPWTLSPENPDHDS
jgi:hypothetical protein